MGNCNCKQGTNGTAAVCTECDILQLARNNYFTGKLLVERDFTDEQRYTMGKLRRHNQRLHGWGTVCGLKVKQHPNPACQSQYVVVEPGTAIDCCGREILLNCEEYFDFEAKFLANWQKNNPGSTAPASTPCTLQICLSYRECPTEKVPALFDDCSGGGGACQPNRILEGHCFDVIVNGASATSDPAGVLLHWEFTKNIAYAVRAAEDDASQSLYVLTSNPTTATATLYVFDTANYALLTPITFSNAAGLDLAVSATGDLIYVAIQPTSSGGPVVPAQLNVYNASTLALVSQQNLPTGASTETAIQLAVNPTTEGSLFTLGAVTGIVAWSGLNAASPAPVQTPVTLANAVNMVVSPDGQYAYVSVSGSGSATINVITVSSLTVTASNNITLTATSGTPAPTSLAIAPTTTGSTLAALDTVAQTLYFVDIPTGGPAQAMQVNTAVAGFKYAPLKVLLSPAGNWAYVLEQDTSTTPPNAYLQSVDEHAVEAGTTTNFLGTPILVGVGPQSEAISRDGTLLYIPFQNATSPNLGGVALVDVLQQDCGDIFQNVIDCCPDCSQGNCLVLATINGYVYGNAITDPTPGSPIANGQIDNLTDRRLLVSTDVLTKAVQCLMDQSVATSSTGTTGATGPGLQTGLVQISALSWQHSGHLGSNELSMISMPLIAAENASGQGTAGASTAYDGTFSPILSPGAEVMIAGFTNAQNNGRFLVVSCTATQLTVSNGNGIAEKASGTASVPGLVIAFNGGPGVQVQVPTAQDAAQIFQVIVDPITEDYTLTQGYKIPCSLSGGVVAVTATLDSTNPNLVASAALTTGSPTTTSALAFVFDTNTAGFRNGIAGQVGGNRNVLIRLRGDFLIDTVGRAISAEFVRAELPTGEQPSKSGLGLQGGTFESWFVVMH